MLVLGHRGASAAYPENTVAAFRGAVAQGADGVELDVRRTAEGELAVCHDARLGDGRLVAEVRAADLPAGVPRLAEALDACDGLALVNIEIKNLPGEPGFDDQERAADAVVAAVREHPSGPPGVLVSSFHRPTIDRVKALDPEVATGWLAVDVPDLPRFLDRAVHHGHDVVHPHVAFVTSELIDQAHRLGLRVVAWTVDDPARIRELAADGADAAITNVPDVALRALGR